MSLADSIRTARAHGWCGLFLFGEAFVLLGLIRAAILLLPFRRVTSLLGLVQGDGTAMPHREQQPRATEISWAISAASRRTPWESACLAQGIAGIIMLSRRGMRGTLYLGVARNITEAGSLDAHAWLRCGDIVVTGEGGMERYAAVSSFSRQQPVRSSQQSGTQ